MMIYLHYQTKKKGFEPTNPLAMPRDVMLAEKTRAIDFHVL